MERNEILLPLTPNYFLRLDLVPVQSKVIAAVAPDKNIFVLALATAQATKYPILAPTFLF